MKNLPDEKYINLCYFFGYDFKHLNEYDSYKTITDLYEYSFRVLDRDFEFIKIGNSITFSFNNYKLYFLDDDKFDIVDTLFTMISNLIIEKGKEGFNFDYNNEIRLSEFDNTEWFRITDGYNYTIGSHFYKTLKYIWDRHKKSLVNTLK